MEVAPFGSDLQLYRKFHISTEGNLHRYAADVAGGNINSAEKATIPEQPTIPLGDPNIGSFLQHELVTPRLNAIGSRLWLLAKQDSTHISSLTHQLVRGRNIIVTENPELHLVWIHDRVFLKPLPKYLLSFDFWQFYFGSKTSPIQDAQQRETILRAARGFLRSYCYLIQHRSDFLLAIDAKHRLLPRKTKYSAFIRLTAACQMSIADMDVSSRYSFGELRLSRLNFWSRVFLHQSTFFKVHGQYGARLAHYYGPILSVFGALAVVLNAMQVALAAEPLLHPQLNLTGARIRLVQVSWGFSIYSIALSALLISFVLFGFGFLLSREVLYALKDLVRKRGKVRR